MQKFTNFQPNNEYIWNIRVKNEPNNCWFISAHAPKGEKKLLMEQASKQDMLTICEDFNAQIEQEVIYRSTVGANSIYRVSNDNGTRLIQPGESSIMLIKSKLIEHKNILEQTWISNDSTTRNEIDRIQVDARCSSTNSHVWNSRDADADSDTYCCWQNSD